jgi:hypothetical protein
MKCRPQLKKLLKAYKLVNEGMEELKEKENQDEWIDASFFLFQTIMNEVNEGNEDKDFYDFCGVDEANDTFEKAYIKGLISTDEYYNAFKLMSEGENDIVIDMVYKTKKRMKDNIETYVLE